MEERWVGGTRCYRLAVLCVCWEVAENEIAVATEYLENVNGIVSEIEAVDEVEANVEVDDV